MHTETTDYIVEVFKKAYFLRLAVSRHIYVGNQPLNGDFSLLFPFFFSKYDIFRKKI